MQNTAICHHPSFILLHQCLLTKLKRDRAMRAALALEDGFLGLVWGWPVPVWPQQSVPAAPHAAGRFNQCLTAVRPRCHCHCSNNEN